MSDEEHPLYMIDPQSNSVAVVPEATENMLVGILGDALKEVDVFRRNIIPDLEQALNLIRQYQRSLDTLAANDPHLVEANTLLRKYKMASGHTKDQPNRIYADGVDITEHPDSIEGSLGPDRIELVRDNKTGEMHFLPAGNDEEVYDAEIIEDE